MSKQRVVIVGAGHNGLIAACYLARAGRDVLVLEQSTAPGGGSRTEERVPGYRFDMHAVAHNILNMTAIPSELDLAGVFAGAAMHTPVHVTEQALAILKRFGSVTVLNGHIHQVMQKVEGNVTFHSAMSTAFPQPAPGSAPSAGPMIVPADKLRRVLGVTSVNFTAGNHHLATVDTPLA